MTPTEFAHPLLPAPKMLVQAAADSAADRPRHATCAERRRRSAVGQSARICRTTQGQGRGRSRGGRQVGKRDGHGPWRQTARRGPRDSGAQTGRNRPRFRSSESRRRRQDLRSGGRRRQRGATGIRPGGGGNSRRPRAATSIRPWLTISPGLMKRPRPRGTPRRRPRTMPTRRSPTP